MTKYIDADKLLEEMEFVTTDPTCPMHIAATIDQIISLSPAADVVEVKHGKWTLEMDGSGICSKCNRWQVAVWDDDGWQKYCGHCGARMDGGKENDL